MADTESLIHAENHQQKGEQQLKAKVICQVLEKIFAVRRLQFGELECSRKQDKSQRADLERIVKLQAADEKSHLLFMVFQHRYRRQQHQPKADDCAQVDHQRDQMKPRIEHRAMGSSPTEARALL